MVRYFAVLACRNLRRSCPLDDQPKMPRAHWPVEIQFSSEGPQDFALRASQCRISRSCRKRWPICVHLDLQNKRKDLPKAHPGYRGLFCPIAILDRKITALQAQ